MRQFINSGRPVGRGTKAKARPFSFGRKLSVERMEGRLMLSATAAEVPAIDVKSITDFDGNLYLVSSLDRYTSNFAQVDGGLISTGSLNVTPVTDSYVPNLDSDSPLVFSGDSSTHGFSDSGSGGLNAWDNELSASGTSALQPITIVRNWPSGVLESSSGRATLTTTKTAIAEGGSISLPTLIAGLRLEKISQESSNGSTVAAAKEVSTPSSWPSAPNSLSGEWARAAVFSMVGNERDGLMEQPLHRGRNTSAGEPNYSNTPAAANGIPRGAAKPTATSDSANNTSKSPSVNEARTSATGKQQPRTSAIQTIHATPVAASRVDPQQAATSPFTTAVLMRDVAARDSAGGEDKRTSANLTAAYDEIGNDSDSGSVFSANSLWRRRYVAAPLLLVLAVERIAALSSREAAKPATPKIGQPWRRTGVQR